MSIHTCASKPMHIKPRGTIIINTSEKVVNDVTMRNKTLGPIHNERSMGKIQQQQQYEDKYKPVKKQQSSAVDVDLHTISVIG